MQFFSVLQSIELCLGAGDGIPTNHVSDGITVPDQFIACCVLEVHSRAHILGNDFQRI